MMRACGARVALLDCLDRTWSDMGWPTPHATGRGHYPKTPVPKPARLAGIPRRYARYGLPRDAVREALKRLDPPPDAVFITSVMTYWYPGVVAAARMAKEIWPRAPVVLGGVYATLCPEHARAIEHVDLVVQGPLEDPGNWSAVWRWFGRSAPEIPEEAGMAQALDLYPEPGFSVILGSRGCPFSCAYCASKQLQPAFRFRDPERVLSGVQADLDRGVRDFAFYDDALLVEPERWLAPLLRRLASGPERVRLHTPNALHVRHLTPDICRLLSRAGCCTVRLGLETSKFRERWDAKLTAEEWRSGLARLFEAGFRHDQIGAYILFGLPGQDPGEIEQSIRFARSFGIRPHLAHYTPIPGTRLFETARKHSPYPLESEPLFQNNSVWPCYPGGFSWREHGRWKSLLRGERAA
jgi:radical SAM superfamily enzyme YgiQ (UPF0313 family)